MRKLLAAFALVCALSLALAAPAEAITYGQPDGGRHPNVGALIAEWRTPGVKEQLCSGTLISPTVFLTAGHCTAHLESLGIPNDQVWVSFDQDVDPITKRTTLFQGTWVTNPNYNQRQSDPGDLAVVLFDDALSITPAQLPKAGLFDQMKAAGTLNGTRFTAVGYGVHEPEIGGGPPTFPYDGERWRAVSEFSALSSAWLRLSQNDATSDGGTCYGDSGGPNFLGARNTETKIVASVTVTGDAMCQATNVTYRLDTVSARGFIGQYVTLP
jgi:secreted trypsin-like serine protease